MATLFERWDHARHADGEQQTQQLYRKVQKGSYYPCHLREVSIVRTLMVSLPVRPCSCSWMPALASLGINPFSRVLSAVPNQIGLFFRDEWGASGLCRPFCQIVGSNVGRCDGVDGQRSEPDLVVNKISFATGGPCLTRYYLRFGNARLLICAPIICYESVSPSSE